MFLVLIVTIAFYYKGCFYKNPPETVVMLMILMLHTTQFFGIMDNVLGFQS